MTSAPPTPDDLLLAAELQFKFALGISAAVISNDEPVCSELSVFSWGRHRTEPGELFLTKKQERLASSMVEHTATYAMAVQLDRALQDLLTDRFHHANADLRAASWIARLIRNAFAHDPLNPVWKVQPEAIDRRFVLDGVIELDTTALDGKPVSRSDYGGPLALLRLLQYVRRRVTVPPRPSDGSRAA